MIEIQIFLWKPNVGNTGFLGLELIDPYLDVYRIRVL